MWFVLKVPNHFEYLEYRSCGFDIFWQTIKVDLIVHTWTLSNRLTKLELFCIAVAFICLWNRYQVSQSTYRFVFLLILSFPKFISAVEMPYMRKYTPYTFYFGRTRRDRWWRSGKGTVWKSKRDVRISVWSLNGITLQRT